MKKKKKQVVCDRDSGRVSRQTVPMRRLPKIMILSAVECRVVNGETVRGKMQKKIGFLQSLISGVDSRCKSQRRKEAFVFGKRVYSGLITVR